MARSLPQLDGGLFLSDGGIETSLIFNDGLELPDFAAFDLLRRAGGEETLRAYFRPYLEIARRHGAGFVFESPTWRASSGWGERLGYSAQEIATANRRSIALLEELRAEFSDVTTLISGCVGPRGDGYVPGQLMSEKEAQGYHRAQIEVLASSGVDLTSAITMNYVEEAIGIARAGVAAGLPVVISFTVETDGRLPTGQGLGEAIEQVDRSTAGGPAYYMINCAHPAHFDHVLVAGSPWLARIRGLRANASRMSHAELNEAPAIDIGDPPDLGRLYAGLARRLPQLNVLGGCCGTDHRHLAEIAAACAPLFA